MSHFSVAVFVDDNTTVHELLAPYDENLSGAAIRIVYKGRID